MVWYDLCRWRTNSPVLGGASNWVGTYKKGYKDVCDARPWRGMGGIVANHPAPFSTLKLEPRAGNTVFHHYIRIMQVRGLLCGQLLTRTPYLCATWQGLYSRTETKKTCVTMRLDSAQNINTILGLIVNTNGRAYAVIWEQKNLHFGLLKRLHLCFDSETSNAVCIIYNW